ncbi:MAG: tetratricopeptide repeat protein [Clostridia bacterium]|nr:tetratricopeptide repeat protein [Clostridia bacterium]
MNSVDDPECKFCGAKFSVRCGTCGSPNPSPAKFCFNCGVRLKGTGVQSSVENFGTLVESRRNVAVVFADISGFTALSEKMDPEEVRELINECFNYITLPVYELEGTIDKYIGDCVMILFGARQSHTDDARRAVACAIKMMELIHDFSEKTQASLGVELNLSIGINYGLVVTGSVGNYFDRDYTVMGDIVNTANRLQTSAGKGTILVSESIVAETRDFFVYSEPREVAVKNKEKPVRCYAALRINAALSNENQLSFVERHKELGRLNKLSNDAQNTGFKYVTVLGEAGIGKSRLIKEFIEGLGADTKKIWVECSPMAQKRSHSLMAGMLSGIMNINPSDSPSMKQHRLISFLNFILDTFREDEIQRSGGFLGLLLGLNREPDFQRIFEAMDFEAVRHELTKQLATFFKHLCKRQKLVLIVDDAHWADEHSLELLSELIPLLEHTSFVLVLSARYEPKGFNVQNITREPVIVLNPLGKKGLREMACKLFQCEAVSDELFEAVYRITQGNPLYLTELAMGMKRKGVIEIRDGKAFTESSNLAALPDGIQNLFLSNVSTLGDAALRVLQAASVAGKEFPLSLVRHLLGESSLDDELIELPVQMNILKLRKIHTSSRTIEKVLEFTHEIEREAIYGSLLNKDKKVLHKKTGEFIESAYEKDIADYLEVLSEHFLKAGELKKACHYLFETALKHKDLYDFQSAIAYFTRYLELSPQEGAAGDPSREAQANMELGHIYHLLGQADKAIEHLNTVMNKAQSLAQILSASLFTAEIYRDKGMLDEALGLLDQLAPKIPTDSPVYGRWLQLKCYILRIKGDPSALQLAKKSEKLLLRAKDYRNLSETMKNAGLIYFFKGDITNALSFMNKSYQYAEKNNSLDIMAKVSGDMGIIHYQTGHMEEALECYNRSMEVSKKIAYQRGVNAACVNLGILYLDKGLFTKARDLFNEALTLSREISSKLYECATLTNLGDIAYELGEYRVAEQDYRDSLKLALDINAPVEEGINYLGLARVALKTGTYDEGFSVCLESAGKIFADADEAAYSADYHILSGLAAQQQGRTQEAPSHYDTATCIGEECKKERRILKAMRYKGSLLLSQNQGDTALVLFSEGIPIAEKIDSDYDLAKCWYGRYKVLMAMKRTEEARISLMKAHELIGRIDSCRWTAIIQESLDLHG